MERAIYLLQKPPEERSDFDVNCILQYTQNVEFFIKLKKSQGNQDAHIACCKVMELQFSQEGDYVFRFGDQGEHFYIILQGRVGIQIPIYKKTIISWQIFNSYDFENQQQEISILDNLIEGQDYIFMKADNQEFDSQQYVQVSLRQWVQVVVFDQGHSFGELALINDRPRAASVVCLEDCYFSILHKQDYTQILSEIEEQRLNTKIEFLKNLPYFTELSKIALFKLSFFFNVLYVYKNTVLYDQGDNVDGVYFVQYGEFAVKYNQYYQLPISKQKHRYTNIYQTHIISKIQNEVLGLEELIQKQQKRQFQCKCISSEALVYSISKRVNRIQDFMTQITKLQGWKLLIEKNKQDQALYQQCSSTQQELEAAKSVYTRPLQLKGRINRLHHKNGYTIDAKQTKLLLQKINGRMSNIKTPQPNRSYQIDIDSPTLKTPILRPVIKTPKQLWSNTHRIVKQYQERIRSQSPVHQEDFILPLIQRQQQAHSRRPPPSFKNHGIKRSLSPNFFANYGDITI